MPDTLVTLGDFAFSYMEVPERLPFGGQQRLAVHRLPGGGRVVDALGTDPAPIAWSGRFLGAEALARARYLDTLKNAGQPLLLSWGEFLYTVIISDYQPLYERYYNIPYTLTCEVVEDLNAPVLDYPLSGLDDAMLADMNAANSLTGAIGNGTLTGLMSSLQTTVNNVASFANAVQSQINTVLTPLAAVRAQVTSMVGQLSSSVGGLTTLGGLIPGNAVSKSAGNFLSNVSNANQLPQLYTLGNYLDRMQVNLNAHATGGFNPRQMAVDGGDLVKVAQQQYGDPMAWTTLARANHLTDPQLSGPVTLNVPDQSVADGGVLTQ